MANLVISPNGAVFDLPSLVALEHGFFADEGIAVRRMEIDPWLPVGEQVLERDKERAYEQGQAGVYNACEWGVVKRSADSQRGGKILAKRAGITAMGIMVRTDSGIVQPEDLRGVPVAMSNHSGSHYMTLKMLQGFLPRADIAIQHASSPRDRYEALLAGRVQAATLMEPFLSAAERHGARLITLAYYRGGEVGGGDLDEKTLGGWLRAMKRAVREINADPGRYLHYLLDEVPDGLAAAELHVERLRYVDPEPYRREEFLPAYRWMVEWGLLQDGVAYEDVVDTRIAALA
jgi:NitT/TauT family transport system substrate-binding protein